MDHPPPLTKYLPLGLYCFELGFLQSGDLSSSASALPSHFSTHLTSINTNINDVKLDAQDLKASEHHLYCAADSVNLNQQIKPPPLPH